MRLFVFINITVASILFKIFAMRSQKLNKHSKINKGWKSFQPLFIQVYFKSIIG